MSLTTETKDLRSEPSPELPAAVNPPSDEASPTVECWLDVMFGISPNPAVRASFVPITSRYAGGVAEWLSRMWGISGDQIRSAVTVDQWLEAMWGIRPGRSYPTTSATVSACSSEEVGEWLHRMWGLPVNPVTARPAAA